jgi:serine/threonine protein kinase
MAERDDPEIQADRVSRTACPQCSHVVDVSGAEPFSVIECPQCRTRFAAPGRLGQFVLLKLLGKGEMGATYKALDGTLHRYVAVKVMRKALGEDRGRVDGFLAEGRALASLDHPNAVRIYSLGEEKGQPFIVMELVTGSSMDRLFSADEPMDEARALEIALGVAEALHAAREIGLVHGDVKPGNIMLDEKGRAKLVDFGIARFGGGRAGSGEALGTPYYIAPEQVRGRPVDHRADIYSLGASLFHALAARPPFPGSSVKEVLQARLDSPAPDLLKVRPSLHRRTGDVVARMLATEPADRYGDYPELLADLREACRQVTEPEAAGAVETAAEEAIPLAVPVSPGISRLVWAVGGAVAVVAAVIVSWVLLAGVIGTTSGPAQQVADPVFSPPARSIAAATDVAVRCETPGARVH